MNTEPPKEPSAVIRVKDLYKIYRVGETKVRALNGVSFEIPKGEFVAIVGTSGSGKSTLLNMLAGLEKPTKGEILIGNVHIEKLTEKQLVAFRREKVGFIFQSYNLLNTMNAIENVALPLAFRGVPKKERLKKAREYMELVGVDKQEKHRPNHTGKIQSGKRWDGEDRISRHDAAKNGGRHRNPQSKFSAHELPAYDQ